MKITLPQFTGAQTLSIGVLSDTHGLLRPDVVAAMSGSDLILHGGDIGEREILDRLEEIAPVFAVRGNSDFQNWCGRLPNSLTLTVSDLKIHMIHDVSCVGGEILREVSLVVYGHSHKPEIKEVQGVVFLNPGSAGPPRFNLPITAARLNWKRGQKKLEPEFIQLVDRVRIKNQN